MKTEIDEREAELQRRAQERRQKWQAQDLKTRKLGRLKYPYHNTAISFDSPVRKSSV